MYRLLRVDVIIIVILKAHSHTSRHLKWIITNLLEVVLILIDVPKIRDGVCVFGEGGLLRNVNVQQKKIRETELQVQSVKHVWKKQCVRIRLK